MGGRAAFSLRRAVLNRCCRHRARAALLSQRPALSFPRGSGPLLPERPEHPPGHGGHRYPARRSRPAQHLSPTQELPGFLPAPGPVPHPDCPAAAPPPLLLRPLLRLVLLSATPVAGTTSLFAQQFGRDTAPAAESITLSTLLSILTLPLFAVLAEGSACSNRKRRRGRPGWAAAFLFAQKLHVPKPLHSFVVPPVHMKFNT